MFELGAAHSSPSPDDQQGELVATLTSLEPTFSLVNLRPESRYSVHIETPTARLERAIRLHTSASASDNSSGGGGAEVVEIRPLSDEARHAVLALGRDNRARRRLRPAAAMGEFLSTSVRETSVDATTLAANSQRRSRMGSNAQATSGSIIADMWSALAGLADTDTAAAAADESLEARRVTSFDRPVLFVASVCTLATLIVLLSIWAHHARVARRASSQGIKQQHHCNKDRDKAEPPASSDEPLCTTSSSSSSSSGSSAGGGSSTICSSSGCSSSAMNTNCGGGGGQQQQAKQVTRERVANQVSARRRGSFDVLEQQPGAMEWRIDAPWHAAAATLGRRLPNGACGRVNVAQPIPLALLNGSQGRCASGGGGVHRSRSTQSFAGEWPTATPPPPPLWTDAARASDNHGHANSRLISDANALGNGNCGGLTTMTSDTQAAAVAHLCDAQSRPYTLEHCAGGFATTAAAAAKRCVTDANGDKRRRAAPFAPSSTSAFGLAYADCVGTATAGSAKQAATSASRLLNLHSTSDVVVVGNLTKSLLPTTMAAAAAAAAQPTTNFHLEPVTSSHRNESGANNSNISSLLPSASSPTPNVTPGSSQTLLRSHSGVATPTQLQQQQLFADALCCLSTQQSTSGGSACDSGAESMQMADGANHCFSSRQPSADNQAASSRTICERQPATGDEANDAAAAATSLTMTDTITHFGWPLLSAQACDEPLQFIELIPQHILDAQQAEQHRVNFCDVVGNSSKSSSVLSAFAPHKPHHASELIACSPNDCLGLSPASLSQNTESSAATTQTSSLQHSSANRPLVSILKGSKQQARLNARLSPQQLHNQSTS